MERDRESDVRVVDAQLEALENVVRENREAEERRFDRIEERLQAMHDAQIVLLQPGVRVTLGTVVAILAILGPLAAFFVWLVTRLR